VTKTTFGATLALAVMMVGCGDGIGDVTSGGPTGTPTPAPTATPTATPVPTPTPATGNFACQLPRLPNCDAQCCSAGGSVIYRAEIDNAQNTLRTRRPDLYFSNGDVRDAQQWMQILAQELQNNTQGRICAEPLGHDELRVKGDQNVSQHVDVLISDVAPWVGGAYTCRPASF
jgi:hypothetical protein